MAYSSAIKDEILRRLSETTERASLADLGRQYGITRWTIANWARAAGMAIARAKRRNARPLSAALLKRNARIQELRAGGLSSEQIAARFGISQSTVNRAIQGRATSEYGG